MEAIMIGGVAVVAVGGFYAVVDLLNDLGLKRLQVANPAAPSAISLCRTLSTQARIKQMSGMNI